MTDLRTRCDKERLQNKTFFHTRMTFSQSLSAYTKLDYIWFDIFSQSQVKIGKICYCGLLLPQQVLSVVFAASVFVY